jgi:hypothetical protein
VWFFTASINSLPLLFLGNEHQPELFLCKIFKLHLQNPSWWNLLLLLFFNMLRPLRAILIICQEAHYTLITSICCSGRLKINLFWLIFSRLRVQIPPPPPQPRVMGWIPGPPLNATLAWTQAPCLFPWFLYNIPCFFFESILKIESSFTV